MRKTQTSKKVSVIVLCFVLMLSFTLSVSARTLVDTSKPGSLTLLYKYNDIIFEGVEISIYHVADFVTEGSFKLTDTFSKYPVDVVNVKTQAEWNKIASTLDAYVEVEKITPTKTAVTDTEGNAKFDGLSVGLYLVIGCRAEYEIGYCDYDTFLIAVPGLDADDNWIYDVVAKPKVVHHEITGRDIEYTVSKQWKDTGYEEKRPEKVAVDIYKNSEKIETVYLSAENNWSYTWKAKDNGDKWTTIENLVPEGYYVTFETNGNTFIITNVYDGEVPPPPPTGDSANLHFVVIALSIVGTVFIIIGIGRGRKRA